eukprot:12308007-Alexandrium_andersonii.AAC.1
MSCVVPGCIGACSGRHGLEGGVCGPSLRLRLASRAAAIRVCTAPGGVAMRSRRTSIAVTTRWTRERSSVAACAGGGGACAGCAAGSTVACVA